MHSSGNRATPTARRHRRLIATFALPACFVARPELLVGQTVRDSAGIRIVENRAPAWTPVKAWRFSLTPALQIGAVEGHSTVLLNQTRYATRLSDGRIVVAQPSALRVFTGSGTYIQTIGRRGRGPGEFSYGISGVAALSGDSIAVNQARSIMIFDSRGTYVRSFASIPPGLLRDHRAEGGLLLPDGSTLLRLYEPEPAEWKLGVMRRPEGFVRVSPDGPRADTAGFFPGFEQVVAVGGSRPEIDIRPFARAAMAAAGSDRVYIGDSERYAIRAHSLPTLRPVIEIRRQVERVPVTAVAKAEWIERRRKPIENLPPNRRAVEGPMIEREIARADFPRTMPAFRNLLADRIGNLWVLETPVAGKDPTFAVYNRLGQLLGNVSPPKDVTILEIGDEYMLGVWKNEDDVEFVRVYTLIKP